jgi:hypothetical protein
MQEPGVRETRATQLNWTATMFSALRFTESPMRYSPDEDGLAEGFQGNSVGPFGMIWGDGHHSVDVLVDQHRP